MNDTTYNGWTNYETWAVNLWMTNDSGSQSHYAELSQSILQSARATEVLTRRESAKFAFADAIKSEFEEANPLLDKPSVFSDLLNAALGSVNWHEIADSYFEGAI